MWLPWHQPKQLTEPHCTHLWRRDQTVASDPVGFRSPAPPLKRSWGFRGNVKTSSKHNRDLKRFQENNQLGIVATGRREWVVQHGIYCVVLELLRIVGDYVSPVKCAPLLAVWQTIMVTNIAAQLGTWVCGDLPVVEVFAASLVFPRTC